MPTIREQMIDLLSKEERDAYEISQAIGIREKDVFLHLSHIRKSLLSRNQKLYIVPSSCLSCGFTFKDRTRFKKPGHCPLCRSERIRPPRYGIFS